MKKLLHQIFAVSLALLLTGCNYIPGLPTETTTPISTTGGNNETAAPEATEPSTEVSSSVVQLPMAAVALPVLTETAKAADGTEIFHYTYQNISLITPDPQIADQVIIDFLNRIDATRDTAENIHAIAESAYSGTGSFSPYLCMISYEPKRIDAGVLSLLGAQASYYGTRHPETVYSAVNYDLITGEVLMLRDILSEDTAKDVILQAVLDDLDDNSKQLYLYGDYEEIVRQHFSTSAVQRNWYFTADSLCFYFSPNEVAPYTSGVIETKIPYGKLAGLVKDAYFPAEQDTASGTVAAQLFTQADLDAYTRFSEVVLDEDGEKLLLHSDAAVHNIKIETGTWSATGSFYTPQHTVFATANLSAGDAIMIQALLSDASPALRLSYESGEETVRFYIGKENGSVILLPE